jgi:glycosyltransferase involved in cell wall biosynthesis
MTSNHHNHLVSVIIANYNHGQYLDHAVASIENQTYKNIELIIVDDGSTDNGLSLMKLKEYSKRGHKGIILPHNRGKWFALNTAIEEAKGTIITLQDADDRSCVQRIERQVDCMQMMGSYHNLCGFTHCFNEDDMWNASQWKTTKDFEDTEVLSHEHVKKEVYYGWNTPGINHYFVGRDYEVHGASSMFYKQHWRAGMKFLPDSLGLRVQFAEDSCHNTRMTLLLQRTSVLKEPLYCYSRGTATNDAFLKPK